MPRIPADIRISLKKQGGQTHRIELIRQPVGRRYWVRRDGKYSSNVPSDSTVSGTFCAHFRSAFWSLSSLRRPIGVASELWNRQTQGRFGSTTPAVLDGGPYPCGGLQYWHLASGSPCSDRSFCSRPFGELDTFALTPIGAFSAW